MFRKTCALKTRRFVTVGSPSGDLDEAFKRCVIKRFESPPLDLDPTRQILPPRLNRGHHNSVLRPRARSDDRWSARPRDRRVDFRCVVDPTSSIDPRTCN